MRIPNYESVLYTLLISPSLSITSDRNTPKSDTLELCGRHTHRLEHAQRLGSIPPAPPLD